MTTKGRFLEDLIISRKTMEKDAQAAAGDWIAKLSPWDLYFTMTYDPKRPRYVQAPSMWASRRHAMRWLTAVQKSFGREIAAVASLEYQQNGWPHWHGLLSAHGISQWEFMKASELWFKEYGYCKFEQFDPTAAEAACNYVGKYITKGFGEVLFFGAIGEVTQIPLESRP